MQPTAQSQNVEAQAGLATATAQAGTPSVTTGPGDGTFTHPRPPEGWPDRWETERAVALAQAELGGCVLYVRDEGSSVINTDPGFWAREPDADRTERPDAAQFIAEWNAVAYARDPGATPPPPGVWVSEIYEQETA